MLSLDLVLVCLCLCLGLDLLPVPSFAQDSLSFSIDDPNGSASTTRNGEQLDCRCELEPESNIAASSSRSKCRNRDGGRTRGAAAGGQLGPLCDHKRLNFELEVPQRRYTRDLIRLARLIGGGGALPEQETRPKRLVKKYKANIAAVTPMPMPVPFRPSRRSLRKKRDIRGEYDLIKKDYKAVDLMQPEVVQYMPEAARPYFKQQKCLFGGNFESAAPSIRTQALLEADGQQQLLDYDASRLVPAKEYQCPYALAQARPDNLVQARHRAKTQHDVAHKDDQREKVKLFDVLERLFASTATKSSADANGGPLLGSAKTATLSEKRFVGIENEHELSPTELDRILESIVKNEPLFRYGNMPPNAQHLQQIKEFILVILQHYFEHHKDFIDELNGGRFHDLKLSSNMLKSKLMIAPTTGKPYTTSTPHTSSFSSSEEDLPYDEIFGASSNSKPFNFDTD